MKTLTIWVGPMASEKSTGALHKAKRYQRLHKKVKLFRPKISIRSHEKPGLLVTKNGESFKSIDVDSAQEIKDFSNDCEIIWIDEPFLFSDEDVLFEIIQDLRKDKDILVSSLGSDCYLNPFKTTIPRLLAVADEIKQCKADCDCCGAMNKATRTLLCVANIPPGQIHVGGNESYGAVCPGCWTILMDLPADKRKACLTSD